MDITRIYSSNQFPMHLRSSSRYVQNSIFSFRKQQLRDISLRNEISLCMYKYRELTFHNIILFCNILQYSIILQFYLQVDCEFLRICGKFEEAEVQRIRSRVVFSNI